MSSRTALASSLVLVLILAISACAPPREPERVVGGVAPTDLQHATFDGRKPGYLTTLTIPGTDGGPERILHGLVSGTGTRLLEPEWSDICLYAPGCVFAMKDKLFVRMAVHDGPGGATLGPPEATSYDDIAPLERIRDVVCPFVPPRAASARPPIRVRAAHSCDNSAALLDEQGQQVARFRAWMSFRRLGDVIIVETTDGLSRRGLDGAALDQDEPQALVELRYQETGREGHLAERVSAQVFAYPLPAQTKAATRLFWPLDPTTGGLRMDASGQAEAYEPYGYLPADHWHMQPEFTFWIVHFTTPAGPRLGIETVDRAVATGPVYRELVPVPWAAGMNTSPPPYAGFEDFEDPHLSYPLDCFIAQVDDGRWIRIALTRGDRLETGQRFPWSLSATERLATRDEALAVHRACVQKRRDEIHDEFVRRLAMRKADQDRKHELETAYFTSWLAGTSSTSPEIIDMAWRQRGANLMAYARRVITGDRSQVEECAKLKLYLHDNPEVSATDLAWLDAKSDQAQAAQKAWDDGASARIAAQQADYDAFIAKRRLDNQAALEHAAHDTVTGGYYQAPEEKPGDAADAAARARYTRDLERYNSGQQNWAPVAPSR